ncbi:MAG: glycosyltransferase family 4 protein [Christensenellales bacterium]
MKKVLFLVNHDVVIYNFRLELVEALLALEYDVTVSCPYGERIDDLVSLGCAFIDTPVARHSINPFHDLALYSNYKKIIQAEKPDIVFTYTIKPNIYGGMACASLGVPYVVNITGLGTALENKGVLQKFLIALYRYALRKAQRVFCQNQENVQFFRQHFCLGDRLALLPGSGVNLERFTALPYPGKETIEFAFISRIMKEKGIDLYLDAARKIKERYPNTVFHVCGFCEEDYKSVLGQMTDSGVVVYHGMVRNVRDVLRKIHCTVHPSYYPEGISNVLLESAASARPLITTDRSGCRETVDHEVSGYIVPVRNGAALIHAIERFIALDWQAKRNMGLAGRAKMEKEFSREIITKSYLNEIEIV